MLRITCVILIKKLHANDGKQLGGNYIVLSSFFNNEQLMNHFDLSITMSLSSISNLCLDEQIIAESPVFLGRRSCFVTIILFEFSLYE